MVEKDPKRIPDRKVILQMIILILMFSNDDDDAHGAR
jgi:hypothetical protein